jgi:hypothetical protein
VDIDEFPSEDANQISPCEQAERGLKAIISQYGIDERLTETTIGALQSFLMSAQSDLRLFPIPVKTDIHGGC